LTPQLLKDEQHDATRVRLKSRPEAPQLLKDQQYVAGGPWNGSSNEWRIMEWIPKVGLGSSKMNCWRTTEWILEVGLSRAAKGMNQS
jgi:hypothetical protein